MINIKIVQNVELNLLSGILEIILLSVMEKYRSIHQKHLNLENKLKAWQIK